MKKILAMMLTAAMMLSMGTAAMADDADSEYAPSDATSFVIEKSYTSDETFVPGETLSFTIVADENNPDSEPVISIGENNTFTVSTDAAKVNEITVTVPSYDTAGVYNYTIAENEGNTAGVTKYDTDVTIYVTVLVEYNNDTKKLEIGNDTVDGITYFIKKNTDDTKTDEFVNIFETGDFTVAKNVEGNMADEYDEFEITVTLTSTKPVLTPIEVAGESVAATDANWIPNTAEAPTSWTYTKVLTISESDDPVSFRNIPEGVTVTVVENTDDDKMNGYDHDGYTVNGTKGQSAEFTVDDDTKTVVVENSKTTEVDTGISVDSIPYIAMLGVVAVGGAGFMVSKKRRSED